MSKNYHYKFPYNACFAGTIEHVTSLYVWKQRVIEALERFRRELPHGDVIHNIAIQKQIHLGYSIKMVGFLEGELKISGYHSVILISKNLVEIKVSGKLPDSESLNGPNTGRFRLLFLP